MTLLSLGNKIVNLLEHNKCNVEVVMIICCWSCFLALQLHGVDDAIDKSKKVLTTMSRRITRNKWIVSSVMGALVLAIVVILFYKLSH